MFYTTSEGVIHPLEAVSSPPSQVRQLLSEFSSLNGSGPNGELSYKDWSCLGSPWAAWEEKEDLKRTWKEKRTSEAYDFL